MEQEEMREREGYSEYCSQFLCFIFLCVSCVLERPSERASNERTPLW